MFRRTFLRPVALVTLLVQVLSVVFVGPGGGCCLRMWRCGAAAFEVQGQAVQPCADRAQACGEQVTSCCPSGCGEGRPGPLDTAPVSRIDESLRPSTALGDGPCDPNPLDDSAPCRVWLPDLAPGVVKGPWNGGDVGETGWTCPVDAFITPCLGVAAGGAWGAAATSHRGMTAIGEALRATRLRV